MSKELLSRPIAFPVWRGLSQATRQLLAAWLGLRALMSLWAAWVSPLRPQTELEKAVPLWPPAGPFGTWLDRVLLAPWERRDAIHFVQIVAHGYRADDGSAQFHPLLMWLATPLYFVTGHPLLALMLVGCLASVLLLPAFERLARLDLAPADARVATLLLVCAPPAFILFAPYTEGLFLLCGVLCLWYARQGAWWRAGLAGGLAALTRQQGIFLALPLAYELWVASRVGGQGTGDRGQGTGDRGQGDERREASEEQVVARRPLAVGALRDWLALGLVPLGLLTWLVYRAAALGDLAVSMRDPQSLIYSLVISPSANKIVPHQAFLWPWQALGLALEKLVRAPEYGLIIDLTVAGVFLVLLALAWRGMRASYRIYVVTIVLVSFGYYTGPFYPYMGLPRHLLLAFPLAIGLAPRFRRPRLRMFTLIVSVLGMLFLLLQYVINGWVP